MITVGPLDAIIPTTGVAFDGKNLWVANSDLSSVTEITAPSP